ncbi:MAG: 1,4-alpha-glucan branching protein GlgB [Nitrospiria bacterium]
MAYKGLLTEEDVVLFREGMHPTIYQKMGAHKLDDLSLQGTCFRVWAPNAERVSVIGDFNDWNPSANPLRLRTDDSGIWETTSEDAIVGMAYKYRIVSRYRQYTVDKGDPFAFQFELPPRTASVISDLGYDWHDQAWMNMRRRTNQLDAPISIYEMHIGSWRRVPEEGNRYLNYRELADRLVPYIKEMGFTHVEFLPVMEHPFYGSWGYQVSGYYAPSRRYGNPQDLMFLIDTLHQNDIGVIFDWAPSHFPADEHGLSFFDGTHLFEHADPEKRIHPDWNSCIFNYGRFEVQSFLISNAIFWFDTYHIDAIRVDAVASMLYLDYSREEGDWSPNRYGGRESLEAVSFLKRLNETVYRRFPDAQTIAEESTAWPLVSRPTYLGGLGFGMKWNMGWMHDTLSYLSKDPVHRKYHHDQLTFSLCYAFSENFVLPLSHDEVVHGKKSLLNKMPGDPWQQFSNLRLLYGYFFGHPGKKLLFMGGEFAQLQEWHHEASLDWHLLQEASHKGIQWWVSDLNRLYRSEPTLYRKDLVSEGFEWIDCHDQRHSVIAFLRKGEAADPVFVFLCNFTPIPRHDYRIGVPSGGAWQEVLNSDAASYGGSGVGNFGKVEAVAQPSHARSHSISLTLPPLAMIVLKESASSNEKA